MINLSTGNRIKIMIVAGDKQNAGELSKKLLEAGYPDAHVVFNNDDITAKAGEIDPEIVLIDDKHGGGYNPAKAAENISKEYNIPVIFISESPDKLPANLSGFLIKPVDSRLLRSTIEIALRHHRIETDQRGEAEDAQNRSEEEYRQVIENADEAICIVQDGELKSFNPRLLELLGYPEKDVNSRPLLDFVHPDDKKRLAHINYNRNYGGRKNILDFRIIDKENNVKWVRMNSIQIEWKKNAATLNFLIDYTEIHKAQEKLKQSEERFRLFSELSFEGVAIFEDGIILDANESFGKMFGYNFADILGMDIHDLIQSESRDIMQEAILTGEDRLFEAVGKKKDGSTFVGEMAIEPIYYKGRNCRFISVRNIVKRLQAESDRRESEDRLQKMLDMVQTGILLIDPRAHIIVDVNVAAAQMIGLPKEKIIGKTCHGFICNAHKGQCLDIDYGRSANNLERELVRGDGTTIPIIKSVAPVRLAGEEYLLESFLDISERKKSEEQQRQLQEKLIRSEKMESMGLLAGGVAHDLNNIITPLVAYPDMILSKLSEDSPVRRQVVRLGRSAQDAADVVQDLLMMARRGRYIMESICLNEVVEDYLDSPGFIRLTEEHPEIIIRKELTTDIPFINGSKVHLLKVIMNLVINAFDAMPKGGQLTIQTSGGHYEKLPDSEAKMEPGNYVRLTVQDTGMGIAKEDIQKIFEPYYSNKTIGRSGSGLGLAVIYGILKDHKGHYDITSEVGKGTGFVLYFPILKSEKADGEKLSAGIKALDQFRGNETILVVDDCEEHKLIAGELLSSMGYKVDSVASGREAVIYLEKSPVDILLLDMVLEDSFDALDTYVEIKKIYPDQKAILLSGYSADELVEKLQKLGAGQFVGKPFSRRKLAEAIRRELDSDRAIMAKQPISAG